MVNNERSKSGPCTFCGAKSVVKHGFDRRFELMKKEKQHSRRAVDPAFGGQNSGYLKMEVERNENGERILRILLFGTAGGL